MSTSFLVDPQSQLSTRALYRKALQKMACNRNILLTGGTGYIGSHTAVELTMRGFKVLLYDNFENSSADVVDKIKKITGKELLFVRGDVRDKSLLTNVLIKHQVGAVIHFAGLKSVSDSNNDPISYYSTNTSGTIDILSAMRSAKVYKFVFSSSATVYGEPVYLPIDESHPTRPINPYGKSKLFSEEVINDITTSSREWSIVALRYFNPIGAHVSGLIGESPSSRPNNLLPILADVATGVRNELNVFGSDYETIDGTGVRDFVHVMDLAEGHVSALQFLEGHRGFEVFNLGTSRGHSVLELVRAYERASNTAIPLKFGPRRHGDVASCFADTTKAANLLNWSARRELDQMCESAWFFTKQKRSQ